MATCESLVRARWVEISPGVKQSQRLRTPEPCGIECTTYEVRAKETNQKKRIKDDNQRSFHGVAHWKIAEGAIYFQVSLCDRHKKKAEREGKKLVPRGN